MKRVIVAVWLIVSIAAWSKDFNTYSVEPVRSYGVGKGINEFAVDLRMEYPGGPLATGFDREGNLFVSDAVRQRLAVGDRSFDIREEHYGTHSGLTLSFEIDERGIHNYHYMDGFSFVDKEYRNQFLISYLNSRYKGATVTNSSLHFGDVVFAYLKSGSLISVVAPSLEWEANSLKMLDPQETVALFGTPEKYGLSGLSLDIGNRLLIRGVIATRSYGPFLSWCEERNDQRLPKTGNAATLSWDPRRVLNSAWYLGKDANGNQYWDASGAVAVFSESGQLVEAFVEAQGWALRAVHPSGDLYGLGYDVKSVRLVRVRNVWDPKARELWEAYVISTTGEGIRSAEVTAGPLRVRRAAGTMAEIEGELAKGDHVEALWHGSEKDAIDGMSEYWYEVRRKSGGLQGWVYGGYLRID